MSEIQGIMIQHSDGEYEYWPIQLEEEDNRAIYHILTKYGDNNPSLRSEIAENCHRMMADLSE